GLFDQDLQPHGLKGFGPAVTAPGPFGKDHGAVVVRRDGACQLPEFGNGLSGILAIDKDRSPMPKVEGDRGDPPTELLFTDEFWVVAAQVPDDRGDVEHALVVGHDDQRPVMGYLPLARKAV